MLLSRLDAWRTRCSRVRVERHFPIGVVDNERRPATCTSCIVKGSDIIIDFVRQALARDVCLLRLAMEYCDYRQLVLTRNVCCVGVVSVVVDVEDDICSQVPSLLRQKCDCRTVVLGVKI